MAITRLSSTDRSRIKHLILFLYTAACMTLGWWVGFVLLLLIVPRRSTELIETERGMHPPQNTIHLVRCQTNLEPRVRRSISGQSPVRRLLPPPPRVGK
jgi:hypothetical protein